MNANLLPTIALVLLGTHPVQAQTAGVRIAGVVVNGTKGGQPVAGAEVVLRAGEEGALQPVAQTVADADGRFVFDRVPAVAGLIILPGANLQGIHYPGPRLQVAPGVVVPLIKLEVFDAVASPNPLVAESRDIDVQVQTSVLEVTETLRIANPSLTTYVGQTDGAYATTLSLSIPDGFERVTFHKEFNGRRFKLIDKRLVSDIPWTPGKREVKFTYHLPLEEGKPLLEWSVDAPCTQVRLRVRGDKLECLESSLRRVATSEASTVVFESAASIPAGQVVKLQLGSLPTPWIVYLRWLALATLAGLILVTAAYRIMRGRRFQADTPAMSQVTRKAA